MNKKIVTISLFTMLLGCASLVVGCSSPSASPNPADDVQNRIFSILKDSQIQNDLIRPNYTLITPDQTKLTFNPPSNQNTLSKQFWLWQQYFTHKIFANANEQLQPIDGYLPLNLFPTEPGLAKSYFAKFNFPAPNSTNQLAWSFSFNNKDYLPDYQNAIREVLNENYIFQLNDFMQVYGAWPVKYAGQTRQNVSLYFQTVIVPLSEYVGINLVHSTIASEQDPSAVLKDVNFDNHNTIVQSIWDNLQKPAFATQFAYLQKNYDLFYNQSNVTISILKVEEPKKQIKIKINVAGQSQRTTQVLYFKYQ